MKKFQWMKLFCGGFLLFSLCYAKRITGQSLEDSDMVFLNISEPYINVKVNDTIFIKCTGKSPLVWVLESPMRSEVVSHTERIFNSENTSIIHLTFHNQEATGRLFCKNSFHNASVYIFVNGEELILAPIDDTIFTANEYIRCIPTVSGANVTLWKDSKQVSLEFDPEKGFHVTALKEYYNGAFNCVAEYDGKTETDLIIVDIMWPTTAIPTVYISNVNATFVMVGSNFSLTCVVRSDVHALVDLKWIYPSQNVTRKVETISIDKDDTYVYLNKTLLIINAPKTSSGLYRCVAWDHVYKENYDEVNVTVYESFPQTVFTFMGDTEQKIANKNEKIDLIALYEVYPPASEIQTKWSKNDEPIVSNFKHNARQMDGYFSLEISDLNGNDSGLYTVVANASGSIASKSFLLLVKDKPYVDMRLNPSCCYSPGQKYNLSCEIKGYPPPSITWSWKSFCSNDTRLCNSSKDSSSWNAFEKFYAVNNSTVTTIIRYSGIISSLSVIAQISGFYKCEAENDIGKAEEEMLFVVSDADKGFEITYKTENFKDASTFTAVCKASFVLYSELQWKWVSNLTNSSQILSDIEQVFSELSIQTELKDITESEDGKYVCAATLRSTGNVIEKSVSLLDVQGAFATFKQGSEINQNVLLILTFFGVLLFLIMAVCVIKIYVNKKKNKVYLEDFRHQFLEGKMALFDSNLPLDEQVDLLPYDEAWEFPRDKLKLGRTLGQGAFGRVVKAEAFEICEDGISSTVAVKMQKERTDRNQQKSLMDELKILIHLGHHVNIVNLLGAVTKNIHKDGLMVIVEYCRYGNIRHYLQRNRERFFSEIDLQSGRIISNGGLFFSDYEINLDSQLELVHNSSSSSSGVFSVHNPNYRQPREKNTISSNPRGSDCSPVHFFGSTSSSSGSVFRSYSKSDSQDPAVTTSDLLCYAFQCARGMDYLASRKLIHRDLAARNVLLAEGKIVKICDFGLAKDCYKDSNYIKKGDGPLPIKWMSIESIWDHIFTTKSDVWSFGIFMWELFTLGGNPYPGLDINEHFYKILKTGYRMEKPDMCPDFAYQIMKDCWNADPDKRPPFNELAEMLGNFLDENIKQHYIDVNEPYMEMNRKQKSPIYSNVEKSEWEENVNLYVNSAVQDIYAQYDVPRVQPTLKRMEAIDGECMECMPTVVCVLYDET